LETVCKRMGRAYRALAAEERLEVDRFEGGHRWHGKRGYEVLDRALRRTPPAPRIVSDVPVSRTLWTVLLPREYRVSLLDGESNLEEVAAAYQQEERKLSFLDELRQMVQVAGRKGKSAARTKAMLNLKHVDSELEYYARQDAQVDARNAEEVQEQARQIEEEIERLQELKTDAEPGGGGTEDYFEQPSNRPGKAWGGVDPDRGVANLSDLHLTGEEAGAENTRGPKGGQTGGRPEQQRGKLREQAAEQLAKLQTMQQEDQAQGKKEVPQQPAETPEGEQPIVAGHLSLDLELPLGGTAYHFRKLHGEPRLVLRARHEDLTRLVSAAVWAGLCLALAAAAVYGLRRPDAAVLAGRGWPWLTAVAGAAWLFLLPGGVFGLALLVTALCALTGRLKKQATGKAVSNS